MKSITRFIEGNLKLKVNQEKSTVDRPWRIKFLGFSFYNSKCAYSGGVEQGERGTLVAWCATD